MELRLGSLKHFSVMSVTIFVFLLGGCAGQPPVGSVVVSEGACCKSVKDFPFRPLPAGHKLEFKISESEPASILDGKLQHFVAFSIAANFQPSTLVVQSYLSGGYLPKATAVNPGFLFLDEHFAIIQKASAINMREESEFWRSGFLGKVIVPEETRYIVVIADQEGYEAMIFHSSNRTPHRIAAAAYGELSISLYGKSADR